MRPVSSTTTRLLLLLAGLVAGLIFYFANPFTLEANANTVLSVAVLMVCWWVTEALPLPVVALLPLILFPMLGIESMERTAAPYANPVIFLFMGGFMLGLAIEKWNLHKRIALNIVRLTGTSGNNIILGFVLATGLLSMWLSNTATTMMMFPIAMSVINVLQYNSVSEGGHRNFSMVLMLVIAYSANIGGVATIIGSPPNAAYVAYLSRQYNQPIAFLDWMLWCLPLVLILLAVMYILLVKSFPNKIKSHGNTRLLIEEEIRKLGPMSVMEGRALMIFLGTAFLWITRDLINEVQDFISLNDSMIAIMGSVALFICPSGSKTEKAGTLLEWSDTSRMAWGILLLFGGGITLAAALEKAGLVQELGAWLAGFAGNPFMLMLVVVLATIFMSELTSNVAQVIVFAPVVSSLAEHAGMNPLVLGLPMTIAASCASMMPMGTPPNAIVFASGHIRLKQMVRAGLIINIVASLLITVYCYLVFGI